MAEKSISQSEVNRVVSSKKIFHDFQDRMIHWMDQNYGRILDLFRRFDSDNSGTISYEEFAAGMKDLGAPATQVEIYLMAKSLDSDGDKEIDYREFKKMRRRFKASAPIKKAAELEEYEEPTAQLQPCPKCNVGLWEPVAEEVTGYVVLDLHSISLQDVTSIPGYISSQVPSNISIYGVTLIVKRELGPCTLNIRIFQSNKNGEKQEMESSKKLRDFGFLGNLPPDEPQQVTLYYDYDYPFLDCPLLMANFSI
ncbi:uncharacterized protein LOC111331113 [Stylophora pistillata]|nr:uncharacterized protein LOC111331113 [Stylophora pistillata]